MMLQTLLGQYSYFASDGKTKNTSEQMDMGCTRELMSQIIS